MGRSFAFSRSRTAPRERRFPESREVPSRSSGSASSSRTPRTADSFCAWSTPRVESSTRKYFETVEPVSRLKTRSAELIRRARDTGQPIVITQNGKATAVLQDVESFERQRNALLLLRYLAQGEEEVRSGKGVPHRKAVRHFEKKLKELRRG